MVMVLIIGILAAVAPVLYGGFAMSNKLYNVDK